jgi:hypothetical protein
VNLLLSEVRENRVMGWPEIIGMLRMVSNRHVENSLREEKAEP